MKRLQLYICVLAAVTMLASCNSEDKREIPFATSGFFTAYTNVNSHIYKITDDMGRTYNVLEDNTELLPNTSERIIASIEGQNGDTMITSKLFPLSEIATLDSKVGSELKVKDPVILKSIYLGGGYLNVHLGVKVKNENSTVHLGYDNVKSDNSNHKIFYSRRTGKKNLIFTLYHNAGNDDPIYTKYTYLSIPVWLHIHKNDTVTFNYKSFEGDRVEKFIYK